VYRRWLRGCPEERLFDPPRHKGGNVHMKEQDC
jgi:hypothetical protein